MAECGGQPGGGGDGQPYLQSPANQDLPAHFAEPAKRELDPDGEEQQDDADFGEPFYAMYVGHEPEGVRAEQHAGHDEARQGRELDPVERQDDEQRDREDHRKIFEDEELLHGARLVFSGFERVVEAARKSLCDGGLRRPP